MVQVIPNPEDLKVADGSYNSAPPNSSANTIRMPENKDGSWTGRVEVTFGDLNYHQLIYYALHGQKVKFGSHALACDVSHSFLTFTESECNSEQKTSIPPAAAATPPHKCQARLENKNSCDIMPCPICESPGGQFFGN